MTLAIICIVIIFLYALLITNFMRGWMNIPLVETKENDIDFPVAIITVCKNESVLLPQLFESIGKQNYPNFKLMLVDDHSTDGSLEYALEAQNHYSWLKVIQNEGNGKKEGIKSAIYQTDARLVVTLDADCLPQPDWLKTIVAFYEETFTDLIICPVKLQSNDRFLEQFQAYEFTSLVASGAGAVGIDAPILCNGANLAFRRLSWLKSSDELHFGERSGDDIYLLQSIKNHKGVIRFLKSKAAMVETPAKKTWHEFFRQRRRWAGKKAAYKDVHLILTACIVFLTSAMMLFSFIYSTIHHGFLLLSCYLFLMKWMVDYTFFRTVKDFFDLKKTGLQSFFFSFIYPFYIVITAFSSLFKKKNSW